MLSPPRALASKRQAFRWILLALNVAQMTENKRGCLVVVVVAFRTTLVMSKAGNFYSSTRDSLA